MKKFDKHLTIEGVSAYYFPMANGDLIYLSIEKSIKRIGECSWVHAFEGVIYPKYCDTFKLIIQYRGANEISEQTKCLDISTGIEVPFKFPTDYLFISNSKDYFVFSNKNIEREKYIHFIKDNNEIWNQKLDIRDIFFGEYYVYVKTKENIISALSYSSGSLYWVFNVHELGNWFDYDNSIKPIQATRILGNCNSNLYVYLDNGRILVLDLESGAKVDILENDKNTDQDSFSGMFMKAIELDQKNGKLIQVFNQRYTEVDLSTGVVTQIHLDEMKEKGLENMDRFIFNDEHIFFSDQYHQKIASLNRDTLKITWIHDLSDDSSSPRFAREIKAGGNKLFALDNKNTLHIFERESSLV